MKYLLKYVNQGTAFILHFEFLSTFAALFENLAIPGW